MKKEIINELERMAKDQEGMILLCAFGCDRIEVKTGEEAYWFAREENSELYDRVVRNYKGREEKAIGLNDLPLSHGICPDCYERELKKLE